MYVIISLYVHNYVCSVYTIFLDSSQLVMHEIIISIATAVHPLCVGGVCVVRKVVVTCAPIAISYSGNNFTSLDTLRFSVCV